MPHQFDAGMVAVHTAGTGRETITTDLVSGPFETTHDPAELPSATLVVDGRLVAGDLCGRPAEQAAGHPQARGVDLDVVADALCDGDESP